MLDCKLTIEFNDGSKEEHILSKPHLLASSPAAAIVFEKEDMMFNIPFTSVKKFYFNPKEYNVLEESGKLQKKFETVKQ